MFHRTRRLERLFTGLALGAGVVAMSSHAWAVTSGSATTATITKYATQAVSASVGGGTVTILSTAGVAYTTQVLPAAQSGSGGITVVATLPTNVAASGTVTAAVTGAACVAQTITGSLGGTPSGNTITFSPITVAAASGTSCVLTINTILNLTGATALATSTTSVTGLAQGFPIKFQVTGISGSSLIPIDTTQAATGLASSGNGLTITLTGPGNATPIDTGASATNGTAARGKVFCQAAACVTGQDSLVYGFTTAGGAGQIAVASSNATTATASGPFIVNGTTTGTVTLTGNLSGIAAIYLDPAGGGAVCQLNSADEALVSNVLTATLSGNTASFGVTGTPVTASATAYEICMYATGTSVIGANVSGLAVSATIGTAVGTAPSTGIGATTYSPSTPYYVTYSGNNAAYPAFLRVVNNSAGPVDIYADVQGDTGSVGSAIVVSKLAPFNNDLYFVGNIVAAAGITPGNFGRASLIIFAAPSNTGIEIGGNTTFGAGSVGISHLMVSPNGTVQQVGGTNSP